MTRIWHHGKIHETAEMPFNLLDRGLTLGDGLFETMLMVDGVPLWCESHLQRLRASAREIGIELPLDAIQYSLDALSEKARGHHTLRLTLTRGAAGRTLSSDGDKPGYFASCSIFDPALMFKPVSLCVVTVARNERSPSSRMKTLSYMDQILAAREAAEEAAEDGLMLNSKGNVACTTIGNVFLVRGNHLITPSRDQGILPGIMRQAVLDSAVAAGFSIEERTVAATEVKDADGMFLTNSLRFLRPVTGYARMDFTPLVEALCGLAAKQCGRDPRSN